MRFPSCTGRVAIGSIDGAVWIVHRSTIRQARQERLADGCPVVRYWYVGSADDKDYHTIYVQSEEQQRQMFHDVVFESSDVLYEWITGDDGSYHLRRTPDVCP